MTGLGAAESMRLRAQTDHLNRLNAAKRTRDDTNAAAVDEIWNSYKAYAEKLQGEQTSADLNTAQEDIERIYGGVGDAASKNAAVREVLMRFEGNADVQKSLTDYATNFQAKAEAVDELLGFYKAMGVDPAAQDSEGMTVDDYKDFWEKAEEERIFNWYASLGAFEQDAVDDKLEALGVTSVKDKAWEAGKAAEKAAIVDRSILGSLSVFGVEWDESSGFVLGENSNITAEKIGEILNDERYIGMSEGIRDELKIFQHTLSEYEEQYGNGTKEELRAAEAAYNAIMSQEAVTSEQVIDFLKKHPNAPKTMVENMQNLLLETVIREDMTPEEMKGMTPESADAYIKALESLLNADGTPNTDLISEELYKNHIEPEREEFESVWGKYREEAERITNETYQKQMAGEEPIKVDGEKWYVVKGSHSYTEKFMKTYEERVNKALGEYGNKENPNIPDKTVIKVRGYGVSYDHFMYDETSDSWLCVAKNKKRIYTDAGGNEYVGYDYIDYSK